MLGIHRLRCRHPCAKPRASYQALEAQKIKKWRFVEKVISVQNWEKYQARKDKDLPWCKLWGALFDKSWMKDLPNDDKFFPLIILDLSRKYGNEIPEENFFEINLYRDYGYKVSTKNVNLLLKALINKGFLSDKCPTNVGLDIDKIRLDKDKEEDKRISQISNLLISFNGLQDKIKAYLEINASKNKTKLLSSKRQQTLLLELVNSRDRCADETLFKFAVEQTVGRGIANIGYINAIIKNKKTQVIEK